ncbi:hypothetical protein GCM10027168_61880 [Streptomyces capparidis]
MDSTTAVFWTCSAVAWVAFLSKLPGLWRRPRNPLRRLVAWCLLCAALILFFAAPRAVGFVNDLTGVPNFAAPLVYTLIVAESAGLQTLLAHWRGPAERARVTARRWAVACPVLVAAIVVLFALGDTPVERRRDFDTHYATTAYIAELIVVYVLVYGAAIGGLAWMGWRWAKVAGRPWLRRGLRVIVVGALCGVGFTLCKLTALAARWAGGDLDWLSTDAAPAFAGLSTLVTPVGFVLPVAGHRLTSLRGRAARLAAYRRLHPLWDALRRATPAIVPPVPVPWWDAELRLTRRLTEILDGRLALRAHTDARLTPIVLRHAREAGLPDAEAAAALEAAHCRAAVAAKERGERFPPPAPSGEGPPGGSDGADELARLVAVSRAFAHSPVVAAAVAEYDESRRSGSLAPAAPGTDGAR